MGEVIAGRFGTSKGATGGDKKRTAKSLAEELLGSATPAEKPDTKPGPAKPRARPAPAQTIEGDNNVQAGGGKARRQSIKGNGNTQIGGDVQQLTIRAQRAPKIEITPPAGTIGADPFLRPRIETLIKDINAKRYERLGKAFKFAALYGELARAFGLGAKDWKAIWLWPAARADEVIAWLESKRDNTQQGRIEKAARREGYRHTRGHLFRIEQECFDRLDLAADSDEVKTLRWRVTGKHSRKDMSDNEFRNWIAFLEEEVARAHGEAKN